MSGGGPADPGIGPAPPGPRAVLAVLVAATVLTAGTNTVMTVVLPEVGRDLGVGPVALSWTATGPLLALAVTAPVYGVLGARSGVRWLFATGVGLFAIGSVTAALAPAIEVLLAARVVQGLGAGAVPALAGLVVVSTVPRHRRGAAFGVIATGNGAAQAGGPAVGGVLAELAGWRAMFVLAGVLAVPLLVAVVRVLPQRRSTEPAGGVDLLGAALLGTAVAAALAATGLRGGPGTGVLVPVAVLAAAGLVLRSATARHPFVPVALLRRPGYLAACVVAAVALGTYLAAEVLVPLQVAALNGLGTGAIGWVLLPGAVLTVLVSTPAGRIADRRGNRVVAATGTGALLGAAVLLSSGAGGHPAVVAAGMAVAGAGFAIVTVAAQNAAGLALDPAVAGAGMGLYQTAYFLAGAVGATTGTVVLAGRAGTPGSWNPLHDGPGADYADALLLLVPVLLAGLAATARLRRA
ncbi:MFS transporter [Pseudonocardia sp. HH130630-07]|uniref:MFS transporter n=1 Tax=Pseudonocardia sp. HH130630-07 TaxID=1690815 RepID=UPI00081536B5|nr:MFS transporter [Pseudonocardia sp. HH130630-07]ANY08112.1 hypothetical protein AFB00_19505 [Pseudonocardia sp. HH130630-07]